MCTMIIGGTDGAAIHLQPTAVWGMRQHNRVSAQI